MLLGEGGAIAGRTAVIGQEHRIALTRRNLARTAVIGVPAIGIMRFGPPMNIEDQRCAAAGGSADRLDQHALDRLPVARGIGHGALRAHVDLRQPGVMRGPAFEIVVLPDEQLAGMAGRVGSDRDPVPGRLDRRQDQCCTVVFGFDGSIGRVDPQRRLRALVDHRRKPPVRQPLGIDRGLGSAFVERAILSCRDIDEIERCRGGIVDVDPGDKRQLRAVGRNFDIADLARGLDHRADPTGGKIEHLHSLRGVTVVDRRGGCAFDKGVARIGGNLEIADVAGDRDRSRRDIHRLADGGAEQAVELRLFLVDDGVEAGLVLAAAGLVLGGGGEQVHRPAVGAPGITAHGGAADFGELALRAAIDRNAPDRALIIILGPEKADPAAIGGEGDAADIHVFRKIVADIVRAVSELELLARAAVFLARSDIGQAGGGKGDPAAIGSDRDRSDVFQLGDILGGHRSR